MRRILIRLKRWLRKRNKYEFDYSYDKYSIDGVYIDKVYKFKKKTLTSKNRNGKIN